VGEVKPFLSYDEAFGWMLGFYGAIVRQVHAAGDEGLYKDAAFMWIEWGEVAFEALVQKDKERCERLAKRARDQISSLVRNDLKPWWREYNPYHRRHARYNAIWYGFVFAAILESIDHER
jgi:hypothetical protein